MIKILHTGDLHLDSPLSSLEFSAAEAAREEHRRVFEKMMRFAIDEALDMILISGDLFDGKYITPRTKELVIKLFGEFGKPIIIAPGNHDPYSVISLYRDGSLPENVYVFSSEELQKYSFEELGVSVLGYAFVSPSLEYSPLARSSYVSVDQRDVKILCAHADTASPISKYAPLTVSDIEKYDFCYAALGHIHKPPMVSSSKTLINYCGFLFGRSFDELGDGGAYLVKIDDGMPTAERIVFSEHRFLREELDVSGAESPADISAKISQFIKDKGYGKETSLRLSLTGTVSIDLVLNTRIFEKECTSLSELEIRDLTTPMPDNDFLLRDPSLRGELYRTLLPKLTSADIEERKCAAEALQLGLCAIDGTNILSILQLDDDKLTGGAQ